MNIPPQIQALMEDKQKLMIAGGALAVLLIVAVVIIMMSSGGGNSGPVDEGSTPLEKDQLVLASVDSLGKAIEVQALLAREGIQINRATVEGAGHQLSFHEGATEGQRDRALLALVQSGLMDGNVGLEAFDKGDLTASREEKRIKLIRAQQGELARLVRKIKPIEDAAVHISIPDPSVFRRDEEPPSVSVQVVLPTGERLTNDKVKSIINLMVGSVHGLNAANVALSDTNGNTYNSVLSGSSELQSKLEQQDHYMRQKVSEQLNKLVGPGHFVVTVSTLLREAPAETMTEMYAPDEKAIRSKQNFTERLNASSEGATVGGAVSTVLPAGLQRLTVDSEGEPVAEAHRGYVREGTEVAYANSRTHRVETSIPGMVEDISIAVTVDSQFFPSDLSEYEFKSLIARSASPKVQLESVSLARTSFQKPSALAAGGSGNQTGAGGAAGGFFGWGSGEAMSIMGMDWIPWAAGAIGVVALLIVIGMMTGNRSQTIVQGADPEVLNQTQQELAQLREMAAQQQQQFQQQQQQTRQMLEEQQRQMLQATQQQQRLLEQQQQSQNRSSQLKQTLAELTSSMAELEDEDEDAAALNLKSWIDS